MQKSTIDRHQLVVFICDRCFDSILFAHIYEGRVFLSRPGARTGTYNRLKEPGFIDQRQEGIPVDRRDACEREPIRIGEGGTIKLLCDRCSNKPPILKKAVGLEQAALDAAAKGLTRITVTPRGQLLPEP